MDFDVIEKIVAKAKIGDKKAMEELTEAFRPFIINLSKKTFITGYDRTDIQNECYKILLKSLQKYNLEKKRFVAYGTNSIKNGIYDLIKTHTKKSASSAENVSELSFDAEMDTLKSNPVVYKDPISNFHNKEDLMNALNDLSCSEKTLINCLFFKDMTLKEYSDASKIAYHKCLRNKKRILNKLCDKLKN